MPYKPKHPCAVRSCPNLTHERYCEAHRKAEAKRYNAFDRDPGTAKRYGQNWKRLRAAFLAANPLCELCKADGRLVPADLVHHKRKLTEGGTNDWPNLQALCQSCHSRIHMTELNRLDKHST